MTLKRLTFLMLIFFACRLPAQTPFSNQEQVQIFCQQLLDSLATPLSPGIDSVGIQIEDRSGGKDVFMKSEFARYFTGKKKIVYSGRAPFTFVITEFDVHIHYRPGALNWIGMSPDVFRTIKVLCSGRIEEASTGKVLSVFRSTHTYRSKIKKKILSRLGKTAYPFIQGQWQAYSPWEKYLEPVVAISSVLIVIYLFFSVRS